MAKKQARRKRRAFTPEFKAEAVRLCKVGDRTVRVQRADVDAGKGPPGAVTTEERSELLELRKRVKRLEVEREILKKATAFFAKESG